MFAKDVLRVLQVSRPTLTKYVKTGIIRVHVMPNGHYDYNEEDVYKFQKLDSQEVFEDMVSLLHCYSMKLDSSHRKPQKNKEAIEDDETSGTPPA